jgi:hypothetical protein
VQQLVSDRDRGGLGSRDVVARLQRYDAEHLAGPCGREHRSCERRDRVAIEPADGHDRPWREQDAPRDSLAKQRREEEQGGEEQRQQLCVAQRTTEHVPVDVLREYVDEDGKEDHSGNTQRDVQTSRAHLQG